ncbi:MAG: hypothetical protein U0235_35400 [Polyangiaceae bacterium]
MTLAWNRVPTAWLSLALLLAGACATSTEPTTDERSATPTATGGSDG